MNLHAARDGEARETASDDELRRRILEQCDRAGQATADAMLKWHTGALDAHQVERALSDVAWDIGRWLRRTFHSRRGVERITWSRGPVAGSAVAHLADGTRIVAACLLELDDALGMSITEIATFFGMTRREFVAWYTSETETFETAESEPGEGFLWEQEQDTREIALRLVEAAMKRVEGDGADAEDGGGPSRVLH
jgi:hypothetical protein